MTEVGLKEDNTANREAWRNRIISYYTGDPDDGTRQGGRRSCYIYLLKEHFSFPVCSDFEKVYTVEPLLYDHPQNHIGVVV